MFRKRGLAAQTRQFLSGSSRLCDSCLEAEVTVRPPKLVRVYGVGVQFVVGLPMQELVSVVVGSETKVLGFNGAYKSSLAALRWISQVKPSLQVQQGRVLLWYGRSCFLRE